MKREALHARKFLNRLLVEAEFRLRRTRVRGRPFILFVDTCNSCNLRCPLCPTGLGMKGRKKGLMQREVFDRVLDELGPFASEMLLYNWGEPLLHQDIFLFIRKAEALGIRTRLSSNMNLFTEEHGMEMIRSGLHRLIISMDGVSEETYKQYRVGGDFEKAKENIKLLSELRRNLRSSRPHMTLQFLVFRHNEHEVPLLEKFIAELGVDDVEIVSGYLGGSGFTPHTGPPHTREVAEKWLSKNPKYRGEFDYFREGDFLSDKHCYFLWRTVSINWDGSISPCCCVYDESTDFGNLMEEPFSRIWNNPKYRSARAVFSRRVPPEPVPTICPVCKVFRPYREQEPGVVDTRGK